MLWWSDTREDFLLCVPPSAQFYIVYSISQRQFSEFFFICSQIEMQILNAGWHKWRMKKKYNITSLILNSVLYFPMLSNEYFPLFAHPVPHATGYITAGYNIIFLCQFKMEMDASKNIQMSPNTVGYIFRSQWRSPTRRTDFSLPRLHALGRKLWLSFVCRCPRFHRMANRIGFFFSRGGGSGSMNIFLPPLCQIFNFSFSHA